MMGMRFVTPRSGWLGHSNAERSNEFLSQSAFDVILFDLSIQGGAADAK
jgi:hypothetical protein